MTSQPTSPPNQKSILILIANGSEEIEFASVYDVSVRAGCNVKSVFVEDDSSASSTSSSSSTSTSALPYVTLSRGLKVIPDLTLSDLLHVHGGTGEGASGYDALVIPGGLQGSKTIASNAAVQSLLAKFHADQDKIVATICAGTLAVRSAGIARGALVTSHPSVREGLGDEYEYSEERVVISDNLITSRGPGTSLLFALTIVERLLGREKREQVGAPMMLADVL